MLVKVMFGLRRDLQGLTRTGNLVVHVPDIFFMGNGLCSGKLCAL